MDRLVTRIKEMPRKERLNVIALVHSRIAWIYEDDSQLKELREERYRTRMQTSKDLASQRSWNTLNDLNYVLTAAVTVEACYYVKELIQGHRKHEAMPK